MDGNTQAGQQFTPGTDLAREVIDTHAHFATCRGELEAKWESNLAAFQRVNAGKQWKIEEAEEWRSKTFLGITRQKVLAAYSLVADGLSSNGKFPFDLVPGFDAATDSADEPAVNALKSTINQQLYDSQSVEALKALALACAIYGEGFCRRVMVPSVVRRYRKVMVANPEKELAFQQAAAEAAAAGSPEPEAPEPDTQWAFDVENQDVPGWRYVSTWDVFRDLETSDIQAGKAIVQVAMMSPGEIRSMRGPGVLTKELKEACTGSANASAANGSSAPPDRRKTKWKFKSIKTLWYWGRVSRKAVEAFELEKGIPAVVIGIHGDNEVPPAVIATSPDDAPTESEDSEDVEVFAVVAGDRVIRFSRVEPNERPWDWVPWESMVDGTASGQGVADAASEMQKVINGAVRTFEDNKKLTSNLTLATREEYLETGAMDKWYPGKIIKMSESCRNVSEAIMPVIMPDVGDSILSLLNYAERWVEDETLIPKISSGLSVNGESGKVTAYEMSTRIDRSGKYIGAVFKNFDHAIQSFVQWVFDVNMAGGELDEACKGDFRVQAKGFDAFNDRASRIDGIQKFLSIVGNIPAMEQKVDYDEPMREICRLHNLNEKSFIKSDERMAQDAAARQNDPEYQLQLKGKQLELAKLEADIMERRAAAVEREARARALLAGIDQGAEKVRMEKADLVHTIETGSKHTVTAATPGKPSHADTPPAPGAARLPESGLPSNNADAGAQGMTALGDPASIGAPVDGSGSGMENAPA